MPHQKLQTSASFLGNRFRNRTINRGTAIKRVITSELLHYKATSKNPKLCVTLPAQNAHYLNVNSAIGSVAR